MWTDQWDSGEVDHVIVMIMQDEDSMSEACHRQSWVPELNGPQLGTRFLPLLRHKFTCSPTHKMLLASTVVSCLSGATWGSRSCSRTLQHRWIKPRSSGFVDAPLYLLQRRLVFRITKALSLEDDLVDVHIRHLLVSCSQLDYFHCWDAETVSSWAFSLP